MSILAHDMQITISHRETAYLVLLVKHLKIKPNPTLFAFIITAMIGWRPESMPHDNGKRHGAGRAGGVVL